MMEQYGAFATMEADRLMNTLGLVNFAIEKVANKLPIRSKFNFDVISQNEGPHEALQLVKVLDFFTEEQLERHLLSVSVEFRASFGSRNIPSKALAWDGRVMTAEEFRRTRAEDKGECYLIKMPSGEIIGNQIRSEGIFEGKKGGLFDMQPKELEANNFNPHFTLVPCRKFQGRRLILI